MTAFRDYRPVIQTGAQGRDPRRCAAQKLDHAQLRERFAKIVKRSWSPTPPSEQRSAKQLAPRCCNAAEPNPVAHSRDHTDQRLRVRVLLKFRSRCCVAFQRAARVQR